MRYLGQRPVDGEECVGLELSDPGRKGYAVRLWFDPGHGYVLRRAEERGDLFAPVLSLVQRLPAL